MTVTSKEAEIAEILNADVAVLVMNELGEWDIVLIRRRADSTYGGMLAFAGGRKERKDKGKLRRTAQRELWEELHIRAKLRDLKPVEILDGPGRDPRPGERTSVLYAFVAKEENLTRMRAERGLSIVRMPLRRVRRKDMAFDHFTGIRTLRTWRYA